MKTLNELLQDITILESRGNLEIGITHISIDSREMEKGSLYIAISGGSHDGHAYIASAIEKGAVAIVCEKIPEHTLENITYIRVENSRMATGHIASAFYNHPSRDIKIIGVTGTNGKTTVATLVYQFLQLLGKSSALFSTAGDYFNKKELEVSRHAGTSVEIIEFNRVLRQLVDAGCEYVACEVSSHALDQERIAGLSIDVGVFTNLSQDHLDYHHTMEAYAAAKKRLFDSLSPESYAIMNLDDKYSEYMSRDIQAQVCTYSLNQIDSCAYTSSGAHMIIDGTEYHLPLIGKFNVYNTLAAIESLVAFGFARKEILQHTHKIQPIKGRAEIVKHPEGITGIVDYAHSPDGLENILTAVRTSMEPGERLITIIGCGGDRDTTKRKPMGDIARMYSDHAIFTSDNPRTENPEHIIDMMCEGLGISEKWTRITNRAEAIACALEHAQPGDVVLMAGKGHEEYQEIMGVKHPFSDREVFLRQGR